ncbi:MAG: hypothetical protein JST00_14805 [Deltaproteobacteria bacterium]|nr:hypothetical protein [Deltaproteobacteria bacterium]
MNTTLKTTALFASVALALVACGKKDDAPNGSANGTATSAATLTNAAPAKIGACNKVKNVGKCTEYDLGKDTLGLSKGGCEATDGKWETNACPTEKVFANCQTDSSKIIYYAGTTDPGSALTMDDEFAKLDCEMMSGKLTVTAKVADLVGGDKKAGAGAAGAAAGGAAKKPAAAAPATPGKKK